MTATGVRVSPEWLRLREAADADARSGDLVDRVRALLPAGTSTVVHDLGCGTGSMSRWLAPRLDGPQHWVLHDWDAGLLADAAAGAPQAAADGAVVTVESRMRDVTRLDQTELAGASLITASALLDMMTGDELDGFVRSCVEARCLVLVTLSVVGRVELTPADPLDGILGAAFNDHQRRTTRGRTLLGPDAVGVAVDLFGGLGADVEVSPSPWRLDPGNGALAAEWLTGWVAAACEQRPELTAAGTAYLAGRRADIDAGRLAVTVHHQDLLAHPGRGARE